MLPLLRLLRDPPPHRPLGDFPSPVEVRPEQARRLGARSLSVKREDRNGHPFGGNKLRALEFLLPVIGPSAVSMGGYGSTWCAALATVLQREGGRAYVALFPQPWNAGVAGAMRTTLAAATVHVAGARWRLPGALLRAWRQASRPGRPRWIPAGGAEPRAVLGSVNAALEFVEQVARGEARRPDAVVVPLGSCGTAAGLLLGFGMAGWSDVTLCAVRVTDPWFATAGRVRRLAAGTARLLRSAGYMASFGSVRLRIVPDQLGAGYGHVTHQGTLTAAAFADLGVTLDQTYGAKAAAALRPLADSFPHLCFWNTFDPRLVSEVATVEHPLLHEARAYAESLWPLPKST
jgi:1-aminocyclopropane-1-carboxylate deaminase/D-cysteine desulfhydrase-like pyridoxal-dependent ACC family enzyme